LGILAKYALLYCQLIVKGKSYGVHPLWVPIRDKNHDVFPGVIAGDIGPKLGYSTKDNGFLAFNNYRVSGDALL
jgi:acyl-CoA oxidase